ncbi:protein kinase [Myxococcus sp. K38C18041901]|uniref:protein kinase domain-containing protein n=1 Tax=Myxococcus guangdongensis TaxID=2906760 RepID=UPI0020A830B1|nr:protein kinase [Myxococcus guangdongensis]MCP3063348.1 protein kinase [Myxococcus guangdongensis]
MTPPVPPMPEVCPDENVLAGFVSGVLSGARVPEVAAHLDSCEDCRALVAVVAAEASSPDAGSLTRPDSEEQSTQGSRPSSGARLLEGTRLGSYVLRELLGEGGMGVVYAAEDPRLGRKVAVKLLRPMGEGVEAESRARLLREAQAMARLSHPNVLPIFELGSAEGRDFLAMEWVEGPTLAGWLREKERPWREVLEMFHAAGQGLVAAHQRGLVHRDFKPANVLVGRDGRPRVTDFGLARKWRETVVTGPTADDSLIAAPLGVDAEETALTREGIAPGTPAYMSPEQRRGQPVDARSDQFSFCVALHEALYGARPGQPTKHGAPVKKPPRLTGHVRAALAKGLASEPEARHPSMEALLQALSMQTPRQRAWLGWAAVLCVGLLVGAGAFWWQPGTEPPPSVQDATFMEQVEDARRTGGNTFFPMVLGTPLELRIEGLSRIAIGSTDLVDIKSEPGALLLTPLQVGAGHLLVWTRDGERHLYTVSITRD